MHLGLAGFGRADYGLVHQLLGTRIVEQKRILAVRLIGEAAAAGLLPGELVVEQDGLHSSLREPFRGEGTGRAAAQDSNGLHSFGSFIWDRWRGVLREADRRLAVQWMLQGSLLRKDVRQEAAGLRRREAAHPRARRRVR